MAQGQGLTRTLAVSDREASLGGREASLVEVCAHRAHTLAHMPESCYNAWCGHQRDGVPTMRQVPHSEGADISGGAGAPRTHMTEATHRKGARVERVKVKNGF